MFGSHRTGIAIAVCALGSAACKGQVSTEEEAMWAYVGLDTAVAKALHLGIKGFNEATSANIPSQEDVGDVSGTMTVTGQVDQGASDNKGLRLLIALTDYADDMSEFDVDFTYDTEISILPNLDITLRDIPDGTLEGTLEGEFFMEGELEGQVTLDVTLAGPVQEDPNAPGFVQRVEGQTTIEGTATSSYGTYTIDVIR